MRCEKHISLYFYKNANVAQCASLALRPILVPCSTLLDQQKNQARKCYFCHFLKPAILGAHNINVTDLPSETTVTKEELLKYWYDMAVCRRLEINADMYYKKREIRGFCHLGDGQEAIAIGMEAGMTRNDALITAYRDHNQAYARGISTYEIMAEMMARSTGASKGKGGSMHYYRAATKFYGGNGIVGA